MIRTSFGQALQNATAGMAIIPVSRPSMVVKVVKQEAMFRFQGRLYRFWTLQQTLLEMGFKFSWRGVSWVDYGKPENKNKRRR